MTTLAHQIREARELETNPHLIHRANVILDRIGYGFTYGSDINCMVADSDAWYNENSIWRFLLDKSLTHVTIQDRCSVLDIYREHKRPMPMTEG